VKRVTGLGGVFFKADDPEALYKWYEEHLGIRRDETTAVTFPWRDANDPTREGMTVWSIFKRDTKYFEPSNQPFMLNYCVDNLHELLAALRAEGVAVDDRIEEADYGRFAWLTDPEGNRIELWEPPAPKQP
jgi:predicted enzyme related to lactoylglutathione lyase